jgi:hypothetical protein
MRRTRRRARQRLSVARVRMRCTDRAAGQRAAKGASRYLARLVFNHGTIVSGSRPPQASRSCFAPASEARRERLEWLITEREKRLAEIATPVR